MTTSAQLDAVFSALADPTRRSIVARLAKGETTVGELAKPFRISAPAVTKHLKVLEGAGLITRSRRAQQRPCRLVSSPLKDASAWIERYRALWECRLDRLEDYLLELQGKQAARVTPRTPVTREGVTREGAGAHHAKVAARTTNVRMRETREARKTRETRQVRETREARARKPQ